MFSVVGHVVLVTGASSGLGRRFCRTLHASGTTVVGLARRADRLRELEQELPGFTGITFDVTEDPAAVGGVDLDGAPEQSLRRRQHVGGELLAVQQRQDACSIALVPSPITGEIRPKTLPSGSSR